MPFIPSLPDECCHAGKLLLLSGFLFSHTKLLKGFSPANRVRTTKVQLPKTFTNGGFERFLFVFRTF